MKTHKSKYRALEQQPFAVLNQVQLDVRNQLNEQIRNNNLQYEDVPCLCGNNDYDVICTIETYGLDQQTVICRYCGLSRSNPRLTETEYQHFYVSDVYRLLYCANINEDIKARFDAPDKHYNDSKNILERVRKFKQIDGSTSILEFGSGAGYNLWSFFKAGANCTGIDYSKKSVEIGKEYGLNILQGGLEKIEGQFDIILLCHNLEHLPDPIAALKQIKSHLTTDGLVYISVPNIEHLS